MSTNCLILKNVPLTDSVHHFLYECECWDDDISPGFETIGGIFSSSKYVWYANGPRFEVVELKTGKKIASWTFGSILKDSSAKVTCLAEIPCLAKEIPLLVLGLDYASTGGVICIFDILTSKILRAIQVNDRVSYLHVIDCGNNIFPILGPLKAFDGVIAVGLAGGNVMLIDLCYQCIDEARYINTVEDIKGEVDPSQIIPLTIKDINSIENHKQNATQLGNHLSILLNGNKTPHFTLKGPKGEDRIHVNKAEVLVTSLFYSSQLGSLLVGFNFGAWQIWNMINMKLIYTSPVYEENIPVSHFAVQEPADDPRAFCYVWAVYSNTERNSAGFPIAVLYSLNYETKDFHEGYGYLYQDLQSCAVRFQTELMAVGESSKTAKSAYCLRLTAFNKGCCSRASLQESLEDTLTICSIVWNVSHDKGIDTYMGVFDLNQWYKEQMPSSPQSNSYNFFAHICVSDVLHVTGNTSSLLDVLIDETTINQFIGIQKPEEHYYPTALAYEFSACSDKNIAIIYNKGQQRALLAYFRSTGPLVLLKPKEIFQQTIQLGLTPLYTEPVLSDLNSQREFLLNVALEQQMTGFLYNCVSTWSNGSFSSMGCSLDFFLNWSWNRAIVLKTNADKLCETLFDYSDISLDANNQRILNCCITQLSNLHQVYAYICKENQPSASTVVVVQQQKTWLHMIVTYLEVLQWLMNIGLLPEFSENSSKKTYHRMGLIHAPYPIESLLEYYRQRRSCIKESVLYIDSLLKNEFGEAIQRFWMEDGGNGYYPPPSLQSLLRTYLVENVDIIHKHCVIVYLFLDLAMALDQSRYKHIITHLIKFPAVFKITPSITKIIQAFWQLDHGDFGTAMDQILDPLINATDLKLWHHQTIFNALLQQEQYNFALLYFQVRKPPLQSTEDILNILSLYVFNHAIDEAIKFCRQRSSQDNDAELMRHIFQECIKTDQILEFIYFPLKQKEEAILMKYLEEVSYEHTEEFRVSYYLHRSRYIDIYQMNNKDGVLQPSGLKGQKETGFCDGAMRAITNLFPKVTKDILNICQRDKNIMRTEALRPKPMSVFVHNAKEQAKYKSTLIRAGILKAKEIWTHPVLDKSINNEVPFIRTPIISSSGARKRSSIICPKLINNEDVSSPTKKIRLSVDSNEQPDVHEENILSILDTTKLLTPIVKRKVPLQTHHNQLENERFNIGTPQSILKVKNLVIPESQNSVTTGTNVLGTSTEHLSSPLSASASVLRLTPRRSLSRSVVRFEKLNESPTDSSIDKTAEATNTSNLSKTPEINKSGSHSTESFYSPNTSNEEEHLEPLEKGAVEVETPLVEIKFKKESDSKEITPLQEKSISLRGRSSYRGISSSFPKGSPTEDIRDNHSKIEETSDDLGVETTPRMKTRSTRAISQEPLPIIAAKSCNRRIRGKSEEPPSLVITENLPSHLLSPRRTSLRISSRKSFSKSISEIALQTPMMEHSEYPCKQSHHTDVSSTSSLPSEEFDRFHEQQSFDLPSISLSPMQYTTSFESNVSNVSIKLEQSISKPTITTETEKKQPRRSSIRLKSRKSLSRMVLERNACSLYTSTPHHSFLDDSNKEISEQPSKESSIFEVSDMHISEQEALNRLIENHNVEVPNYSLSADMLSVNSDITSGKDLLEADGTSIHTVPNEVCSNQQSIAMNELSLNEEFEDSTNSHATEGIVIDELNDLKAPEPLSPETSCYSRDMNQSDIHETLPLKLDEVNEKADATHNAKEITEIIEIATTNEIPKPDRTALPELEKESNNSCLPTQIESTGVLEVAVSTTNILAANIDSSEVIEQPENEQTEENEGSENYDFDESNELNYAQIGSDDVIEIADSSSCSNESNVGSINSITNSTINNENSITTIHTDSEEDLEFSSESIEANNFEEYDQNLELVPDIEEELPYPDDERNPDILSDQVENEDAELRNQLEVNAVADNTKEVPCTLSERSKSCEELSSDAILEKVQSDVGSATTEAENITLPQLKTTIVGNSLNVLQESIEIPYSGEQRNEEIFNDEDENMKDELCNQFEENIEADDIEVTVSENNKSSEELNSDVVLEKVQSDIGHNTSVETENITLPQLKTTLLANPLNVLNETIVSSSKTVVFMNANDEKSQVSEETQKSYCFDGNSIEASNFEDVTAKDIFDIFDIDKTACVSISEANILDTSSINKLDSAIDKKELSLKNTQSDDILTTQDSNADKLNDTSSTTANKDPDNAQRRDESTVIASNEQCKEDVKGTPEPSHKMQLRKKRTLSTTSVESPIIRTPRKRSASMDETNISSQKRPQSSDVPQDRLQELKTDKTAEASPRSLRNRRAASVSECVSHEKLATSQKELQPKKKRGGSVMNLPVICEESTKSIRHGKIAEKEEQQLYDELDNYSTTRRLTRNQKHLLEKSQEKQRIHTTAKDERTSMQVAARQRMYTETADTENLASSFTTCESATSDRIRTRRMSQESTSSVVSTVTSVSDTGTPRKRKAQSPKEHGDSPGSRGLRLRSERSRSTDDASVSSQISRSTRTTRKTEASDSDDQSSTVSLRRSTRKKSKTPDPERMSKRSGRSKKTLSKIPEEGDEEVKEVVPVQERKPKKK